MMCGNKCFRVADPPLGAKELLRMAEERKRKKEEEHDAGNNKN